MQTENAPILFIGDIEQALVNSQAARAMPCIACRNVLDGIERAQRQRFSAVAVCINSVSAGGLRAALKILRQVGGGAKIVLLARTYEEPTAMELVGKSPNGTSAADDYLICPVHYSHLSSMITDTQAAGQAPQKPSIIIAPAGAERPVDTSRHMQEKIRHLEKLATEDDLTGLKNRRYILEFSRQIIERAKNDGGRVTLLVFDIDDFKHYNDVYGHPAGDEILREAAVLMVRCCRSQDVVGRIGGDEFAVVFWDLPSLHTSNQADRRSATAEHPKEVLFIAHRFCEAFEKAELPCLGPEGKGVLTISGGLASYPDDGSNTRQLFKQADRALLEAKRSGKNRIYLIGTPEKNTA